MKRKSEEYLNDILEAIRRVKLYLHELDKEEFKKKTLVRDAVLRNLEIIGEAVAQLPDEIKQNHPKVPWRDIKDFRNVVAHHYFELNFDRIWDIIKNKLTPLENKVKFILKEL